MKSGEYVPDAGDLIWIDFDPTKGHEQRWRRPAVVLSPRNYNSRPSWLCIVCPITSQRKGYPWEVPIPSGNGISGVVLADHVRSLSWRARHAEFSGVAPAAILDEVRAMLAVLLLGR